MQNLNFAELPDFLVYQAGPPAEPRLYKMWWRRDGDDVLHYAESYDLVEWVEGEPYASNS